MAISTAQVMNVLTQCLVDMAAKSPHDFPAHELEPPRIKALIESVKRVTAYCRTDAGQGLLDHIQRRLCQKPSQSITVAELYQDYSLFVERRDMVAMPRAKFCRELPRAILEIFTIPRVNNVLRPVEAKTTQLTARRGFHGLALKTDGADARDEADGADGAKNS